MSGNATACPAQAFSIVHFAREPLTGVWSVLRNLALAQKRQGSSVSIVLLATNAWPYFNEISDLGTAVVQCRSPRVFGTAAALYHQLSGGDYMRKLAAAFQRAPQGSVRVLHHHNSWLGGAYAGAKEVGADIEVATFHGCPAAAALRAQPMRRSIHSGWASRLEHRGCILAAVDACTPATIEGLFGIPAAGFSVVPNGVPIPGGARRPKQELSTVGFIGTLSPAKGWWFAAEAVRRLFENGCAVRFRIAGYGPDEAAVRAWCASHSSFAEYAGVVANAAAHLIPSIDALCLPSETEGLPMVALEAMAAGAVVLCTPVGGLKSLVRHRENGFFIERSADSVAAVLEALYRDPATVGGVSAAALETHRANFTDDVMAEAYYRLYSRAAGRQFEQPPYANRAFDNIGFR